MSDISERYRDYARILLAAIRLLNGTVALFTPTLLANRFGTDANSNRVAIYAFRLFGVRTIVGGIELLSPDEQVRTDALRYAIAIHASDTFSAALAGIQRQLPSSTAITLTAISGFNTVLAILAQPRKK